MKYEILSHHVESTINYSRSYLQKDYLVLLDNVSNTYLYLAIST